VRLVALGCAAVAIVVIVPGQVASYWIFLCTAGLLTAIAAMGLSVVVGWIGEISLTGAGLLGTSVYITGYLLREGGTNWNNWPFIPAAIVGFTVTMALGAVVAIPTVRFSGVFVMVLSMGMQITLERTLFTLPWVAGGAGRNFIVSRPRPFGFAFESDLRYFYLCLGAFVASATFVYLLRRSRHGRAMHLIRTDSRAAAALGISPWRYKVLAFAICGALIGVAGAFTAPLYRSPPAIIQFVLFQSLFMLAIPVVAGTDSLLGILVVSLSFALIPTALEDHGLSPYLLGGIGLVAGTIIGPRGLGGNVLDVLQRRREVAVLSRRRAAPLLSTASPASTGEVAT
jgi:ABC-type branched-subunit amino acid transport system permease subunit